MAALRVVAGSLAALLALLAGGDLRGGSGTAPALGLLAYAVSLVAVCHVALALELLMSPRRSSGGGHPAE